MKKCLLLLLAICLFCAGCYKENDLMIGTWVRPSDRNPTKKEGFVLKKHGRAESVNLGTLKYEKWHISDGTLLLDGKDSGAGFAVEVRDIFLIQSVDNLFLVIIPLGQSESISYTRKK